jgi:hypothetical protein
VAEEILEGHLLYEILDANAKVVSHSEIGYSVGTVSHFVPSLISAARVKIPTRPNVIKLFVTVISKGLN